jgi:hypothetical protein
MKVNGGEGKEIARKWQDTGADERAIIISSYVPGQGICRGRAYAHNTSIWVQTSCGMTERRCAGLRGRLMQVAW